MSAFMFGDEWATVFVLRPTKSKFVARAEAWRETGRELVARAEGSSEQDALDKLEVERRRINGDD